MHVLQQRQWMLATAESCTGGWIAKICTDMAGSSTWFDSGFITYSNAAKQTMLGVNPATLLQHGAVSEAVVKEMALGALQHSQAQVALAVSGVAGPGGGTPEKPVGTVCFAWAIEGQCVHTATQYFAGDREAVRWQSVQQALETVVELLRIN